MDLEACLPEGLREGATITRIAAGMSGAGVYRVEAGGRALVLKVTDAGEPVVGWRHRLAMQRAAAGAGVAPEIVHADEARRAVVSALVIDRGFPMLFGNPATRDRAIALLGELLRRVHALPVPDGARSPDPLEWMARMRADLADTPTPPFVGDAIAGALALPPVASDRAPVLSHNDVNPSNLCFDGERLFLLDWDAAGPNDPYYDLAAIALFLRLDDAACRALIAAHDGAPVERVPGRFAYDRRLIAVLCGTAGLDSARRLGHPGDAGAAPVALGDFYQRLRSGQIDLGRAEGRWEFGLALINEAGVRAAPGSDPSPA